MSVGPCSFLEPLEGDLFPCPFLLLWLPLFLTLSLFLHLHSQRQPGKFTWQISLTSTYKDLGIMLGPLGSSRNSPYFKAI